MEDKFSWKEISEKEAIELLKTSMALKVTNVLENKLSGTGIMGMATRNAMKSSGGYETFKKSCVEQAMIGSIKELDKGQEVTHLKGDISLKKEDNKFYIRGVIVK
jgi:hypothetical protein